jgi:hypothetical protein
MMSRKTKLVLAAVGTAVLLTTPAFAAKVHKAKKSANPYASYASDRAYGANTVYGLEGQVLGTDPDPNIRFQLLRDQSLGGD